MEALGFAVDSIDTMFGEAFGNAYRHVRVGQRIVVGRPDCAAASVGQQPASSFRVRSSS